MRIPLPDKLDRVGRALRTIGAGDVIDEFETSLNRAAEAAAPLARDVFHDAIRKMTIDDAVTILRGNSHEATDYLRLHSESTLADRFRPIVSDKLDSVGATREFNELVDRANRLPFVDRPGLDLTAYVTDKALDGLFVELGTEEPRIREDPVGPHDRAVAQVLRGRRVARRYMQNVAATRPKPSVDSPAQLTAVVT